MYRIAIGIGYSFTNGAERMKHKDRINFMDKPKEMYLKIIYCTSEKTTMCRIPKMSNVYYPY